jgi:hypothetical protein
MEDEGVRVGVEALVSRKDFTHRKMVDQAGDESTDQGNQRSRFNSRC